MSIEEISAEKFFQNVMGNIGSIKTFEGGEWQTFNPLKQSNLNTLITLKPGKGIFIKAKNNANWKFNGNELVVV